MQIIESRLILIRGESSSGKSTLARKLIEESLLKFNAAYFEADEFFIDYTGIYKFDANLLSYAHSHCLSKAIRHIAIFNGVAIVANTFTRLWEMELYVKAAQKLDIKTIQILEPTTAWRKNAAECAKRNTHGLTTEMIQKQIDRWENLPVGVHNTEELLKKINGK